MEVQVRDDEEQMQAIEDVVLVRQTDRAWLVRFQDLDEDVWVPKSVASWDGTPKAGESGSLQVETWWARKNGLD